VDPELKFKRFCSRGNVTMVITSKQRPELLEHTLGSFFRWEDSQRISRFILHEDSNDSRVHALVKHRYPQFEIMGGMESVGLNVAIDRLYAVVDTPYVFHCEDDWEFLREGFLDVSFPPLEEDAKVLQVHLRASVNGHPVKSRVEYFGGHPYRELHTGFLGMWHGYSHNPSLRRTEDMRWVLPHTQKLPRASHKMHSVESAMGSRFKDLGYRTLAVTEDYIRHIG
jgi:hypothetical protein